MNPIVISWEAESHDGSVLRERDGHTYREIPRTNLKSFRLVSPGQILLETFTDANRPGRGLCYRRRTVLKQGTGRTQVYYIVGWVPLGPVYVLDVSSEQVSVYGRWGEDGWTAPQPIPEEGEEFTFTEVAHTVDARLRPETIRVPSGMTINVRR